MKFNLANAFVDATVLGDHLDGRLRFRKFILSSFWKLGLIRFDVGNSLGHHTVNRNYDAHK
jgi:hypothetical protein